MYGKLYKNIGFSMIIFAFFFLFEPSYGLIDPLPDIIGYVILYLSLANLADINDHIQSANKAFRMGIIISALRIVAYILIEKVFVGDEQSVGNLLYVFVFVACEFIWILPGFRSLFDGLLSLGMFEGGEAVYYCKKENGKNASEKLKILTYVFFIVKNILWLMPELTTLDGNTTYEFNNIMRILSMIMFSPLAIIWLVNIIKYFIRIKKDTAFISALEQKYISRTEGADDYFICRYVSHGLSLMMIALILSFDIYSENINLLPDICFHLLLICAVAFLHKYSKMWIPIVAVSLIGAVSSVMMSISEKAFFEKFYVESIRRDPDAYESYNKLLLQYIIQSVIFAATAFLVILFLSDIFKKRQLKGGNEELTVKTKSKAFTIKTVVYCVFAVLSAIGSVYYFVSLPRHPYSWIYAYSNVISSVISICFLITAYLLIQSVTEKLRANSQPYI